MVVPSCKELGTFSSLTDETLAPALKCCDASVASGGAVTNASVPSSSFFIAAPEDVLSCGPRDSIAVTRAQVAALPRELLELRRLDSLFIEETVSGAFDLGKLNVLRRLVLRGNSRISLPAGFSPSPNLRELVCAGNGIAGAFPAEILAKGQLEILDLSRNQYSGNLPANLGSSLSKLQVLDLSNNLFNGSVPPLVSLFALHVLNLGNNEFRSLPPRFPELLQTLDARKNALRGTLELDVLADAREVHLQSNPELAVVVRAGEYRLQTLNVKGIRALRIDASAVHAFDNFTCTAGPPDAACVFRGNQLPGPTTVPAAPVVASNLDAAGRPGPAAGSARAPTPPDAAPVPFSIADRCKVTRPCSQTELASVGVNGHDTNLVDPPDGSAAVMTGSGLSERIPMFYVLIVAFSAIGIGMASVVAFNSYRQLRKHKRKRRRLSGKPADFPRPPQPSLAAAPWSASQDHSGGATVASSHQLRGGGGYYNSASDAVTSTVSVRHAKHMSTAAPTIILPGGGGLASEQGASTKSYTSSPFLGSGAGGPGDGTVRVESVTAGTPSDSYPPPWLVASPHQQHQQQEQYLAAPAKSLAPPPPGEAKYRLSAAATRRLSVDSTLSSPVSSASSEESTHRDMAAYLADAIKPPSVPASVARPESGISTSRKGPRPADLVIPVDPAWAATAALATGATGATSSDHRSPRSAAAVLGTPGAYTYEMLGLPTPLPGGGGGGAPVSPAPMFSDPAAVAVAPAAADEEEEGDPLAFLSITGTRNFNAVVVYPHEPDMGDEIGLVVGDEVWVEVAYQDGWAAGVNLTRNVQGVFPLVCLQPTALRQPVAAAAATSWSANAQQTPVSPLPPPPQPSAAQQQQPIGQAPPVSFGDMTSYHSGTLVLTNPGAPSTATGTPADTIPPHGEWRGRPAKSPPNGPAGSAASSPRPPADAPEVSVEMDAAVGEYRPPPVSFAASMNSVSNAGSPCDVRPPELDDPERDFLRGLTSPTSSTQSHLSVSPPAAAAARPESPSPPHLAAIVTDVTLPPRRGSHAKPPPKHVQLATASGLVAPIVTSNLAKRRPTRPTSATADVTVAEIARAAADTVRAPPPAALARPMSADLVTPVSAASPVSSVSVLGPLSSSCPLLESMLVRSATAKAEEFTDDDDDDDDVATVIVTPAEDDSETSPGAASGSGGGGSGNAAMILERAPARWNEYHQLSAHAPADHSHDAGAGAASWPLRVVGRLNLRSSSWFPLVVSCGIVSIGVGAAIGLLIWFTNVETHTFEREFRTQCQLSVRSLEAVLHVRLKQFTENVSAYTYSSTEVTNGTFIAFMNRSSFNPRIVYSVALAPVVSRDELPLFERLYAKKAWNNDTGLVAGDPSLVPLPLIYPESRFRSPFVGMNLLSSASRRKAVLEANRTGTWAISPPVAFVDIAELGMIAFKFARERPAATKDTPFTHWVTAVSMLVKDLFTQTLDHTRGVPTRTEAALHIVYQPTQEKVFMYGPTDRADLVARDRYVLPFRAASEAPWSAECIPSRSYRSQFSTVWPWVLFGVVLASSAVMAELARRGLHRVIVSQQTLHQLRAQERLLGTLQQYSKAITQAIPDAMVLLDSDGRIIGVNDATMQITGYSMAELNEMHVSEVLAVDADEIRLPQLRLPSSAHVVRRSLPLEPGTREGTVQRSDGSTVPVQVSISVVEASEVDGEPTRPRISSSSTTASRSSASDAFAQIALFHNISDQVEHVRVAAALERRATDAAQARNRLLGFILGSVADLASDMVADLAESDALLEERGYVGELADASEAARHMKAMLDDVAGFAGIAVPPPAFDGSRPPRVNGMVYSLESVLRRVIDGALDERRPAVHAKQLAILTDVQLQGLLPPLAVAAARYLDSDVGTELRAVLAKTVAVGVGASLPLARWLVLVTVTPVEDPLGPPINQTSSLRPTRSSRNSSATARLEITVSVTISRVAPGCIAIRPLSSDQAGTAVHQDLDLSLGSRGARFGNVALTYAALVQMAARLGGTAEHTAAAARGEGGRSELTVRVRVPFIVRTDRV
ncbi:hypothetical protein H9P43_003304 [Blastocladiella emersonii ATCC 22665]|nr:hypothetical protein H9P43_003304 [Blastocladiella emersonii ATCC 22665]